MIGIFDSGIGGVSVLLEILKVIPNGEFLYYSDSINNPYGDKSEDELYLIVKRVVDYLLDKGCVAIVIACNTASAICSKKLRDKYKDVLFIAIEPAYKMVYDYSYNNSTLVMATKGTLLSEKFLNLYHKYNNHNTHLLPCVGLSDLIEEGDLLKIEEYLFDKLSCYKGVKNVVLGCTHYPLVKDSIKKVLGDVSFFDGSVGVSNELIRQLNNRNIDYNNNSLNIKFIDSSNDSFKEERFKKIIKESLDS